MDRIFQRIEYHPDISIGIDEKCSSTMVNLIIPHVSGIFCVESSFDAEDSLESLQFCTFQTQIAEIRSEGLGVARQDGMGIPVRIHGHENSPQPDLLFRSRLDEQGQIGEGCRADILAVRKPENNQ